MESAPRFGQIPGIRVGVTPFGVGGSPPAALFGARRPWYYEAGQGRLFNLWSLSHVAWGVAAQLVLGRYWPGIALHTAYEIAEDWIYPYEGRDRSFTNNVGDTIAFVAGQVLGAWLASLSPAELDLRRPW